MTPSFFVVGHHGMLGHVVTAHLRHHGHDVFTSDERYVGSADDPLIRSVVESKADIVVNCAGVTTARRLTDQRLLTANTLLPLHLAGSLAGRPLIHASTDCVFRGDRGYYDVGDRPDAVEPYGFSKRLGEACLSESAVLVVRTSIVGPELDTLRGLLAWFLAQSEPVDGWVDHLWNGITTVQWARLCRAYGRGELGQMSGLTQPTTEAVVSKYELLTLFADTFGHRIPIRPVSTSQPIDRSLRPTIAAPPIRDQLNELRAWMQRGA